MKILKSFSKNMGKGSNAHNRALTDHASCYFILRQALVKPSFTCFKKFLDFFFRLFFATRFALCCTPWSLGSSSPSGSKLRSTTYWSSLGQTTPSTKGRFPQDSPSSRGTKVATVKGPRQTELVWYFNKNCPQGKVCTERRKHFRVLFIFDAFSEVPLKIAPKSSSKWSTHNQGV